MNDPKAAARELISIADNEMDAKWKASPAVLGGSTLGLVLGNWEAGVAYVKVAGEWLAAANQTMGALDENDPDTVIDQLGQRIVQVEQRRTKLFSMGIGQADALSVGLETFVTETVARIKAVVEWLKKHAPDPDHLPKYGIGILVLVLAIAIALR